MEDFQYREKLQKKLAQSPNDVKLLIELGFMYMEDMEDVDQALQLLNRAIELDPNNVEALFWLAKSYFHCVFDDEKTKEILEKALKLDPKAAACHDLLADVLSHLGESREKSIYHLRKAVEAEPTWIHCGARLSSYLMKNHDFDKAEVVAKETIKVFKNLEFPLPKTPMKEYYAECVTGKTKYGKERLN
ncbi:tetratricopeptide repeat protein, partial [Candidatus Babeliales bacterium]|nr:tetratricopeptide repeat protein [Candidatus Babeliales bacterium]